MITQAMILCAGFGKRLNPLTLELPKPLLPIGKETLLSNTINFLIHFKIKKIVINVHYLGDQIIEYVNKRNFKTKITIVKEKDKILDTGGGILNAINHFDESFLCINPDTIWNVNYAKELKKMENNFFLNKKECSLLVVNKIKSFDRMMKGDFNLEGDLVTKKKNEDLKYIFTGLQIISPKAFLNIKDEVFSINKVWNQLIQKKKLHAIESNINFHHISNIDIYKKLNIK